MRNKAIRAILDTFFGVSKVASALISKCIQRTEAEKAIKVFGIFHIVAGKVFTLPVLEKA